MLAEADAPTSGTAAALVDPGRIGLDAMAGAVKSGLGHRYRGKRQPTRTADAGTLGPLLPIGSSGMLTSVRVVSSVSQKIPKALTSFD